MFRGLPLRQRGGAASRQVSVWPMVTVLICICAHEGRSSFLAKVLTGWEIRKEQEQTCGAKRFPPMPCLHSFQKIFHRNSCSWSSLLSSSPSRVPFLATITVGPTASLGNLFSTSPPRTLNTVTCCSSGEADLISSSFCI